VLCVTKYCCNGGFIMEKDLVVGLCIILSVGYVCMSLALDKNNKLHQVMGGGLMLGALLSIQGIFENLTPGVSQFFGAFMFCWVAAMMLYLFDAHRTATSIFCFGMVFVIGSFMTPENPDRWTTLLLFLYPTIYMMTGLFLAAKFRKFPACRPLWAL